MTEIEAGASAIFCSKPPAVVTTMVCNLVVSVCNVAFCSSVTWSCACTETANAESTAKAKVDFINGLLIFEGAPKVDL